MAKRSNERPKTPPFAVGERVTLDSQPFEWTVDEVNIKGLPWVAKITRQGEPDDILQTVSREVDTDRLTLIPEGYSRR